MPLADRTGCVTSQPVLCNREQVPTGRDHRSSEGSRQESVQVPATPPILAKTTVNPASQPGLFVASGPKSSRANAQSGSPDRPPPPLPPLRSRSAPAASRLQSVLIVSVEKVRPHHLSVTGAAQTPRAGERP